MANSAQVVIIGVIGVAALLILILIPTSFSDVEYYEVSFWVQLFLLSARKDWSSTNTAIIATLFKSFQVPSIAPMKPWYRAVSPAHCKVVVIRHFQLILDFCKGCKKGFSIIILKWFGVYDTLSHQFRTLWTFKLHALQLNSTFEEWVHKHEIKENCTVFFCCCYIYVVREAVYTCINVHDRQTRFRNSVLSQAFWIYFLNICNEINKHLVT